MSKKKDVTALFANAFTKYDAIETQVQGGGMPLQGKPFKPTPENDAIAKAYNASLYPEKAGQRAKEQKDKEAEEYESFVKSLTVSEVDNLQFICKRNHLVVDIKVLKSMGETGEDLGIERLDTYGLIKRELIPDDGLIQFRITGKGRQVLRDLGY